MAFSLPRQRKTYTDPAKLNDHADPGTQCRSHQRAVWLATDAKNKTSLEIAKEALPVLTAANLKLVKYQLHVLLFPADVSFDPAAAEVHRNGGGTDFRIPIASESFLPLDETNLELAVTDWKDPKTNAHKLNDGREYYRLEWLNDDLAAMA